MPRSGSRNRYRPPSDDDWIMNQIRTSIQEAMAKPKPEPSEPWWKTGLTKVLPTVAATVAARAGAGQFKPEGGAGYVGVEGSMARALKSKGKAIEDAIKVREEIKRQKEQNRVTKAMQLTNLMTNLKRLESDMQQRESADKWRRIEWEAGEPLRGLELEKQKQIIANQVQEGRLTQAQADKMNAEMEYFKKHGKWPGRESVVTYTGGAGGAGGKPEAVESLDKKIYDLINKVGNSENYEKFTALQGATTEEELDVLYNQYVNTMPTTDIYGGNKGTFDVLYRYMKERFRKRPLNVPAAAAKKETPVVEGSEPSAVNPLGLNLFD